MDSPEVMARSWVGTPFAHQGRIPGVMLDCAGVIVCIARARGHVASDWDLSNYAQRPDKTSVLDACDTHLVKIEVIDAQPSDVLVIAWDRYPQHLGIMGVYAPQPSERTIIHAFKREGERNPVMREHRLMPDLRKRVVAAYRFPEI